MLKQVDFNFKQGILIFKKSPLLKFTHSKVQKKWCKFCGPLFLYYVKQRTYGGATYFWTSLYFFIFLW